jgi:hypothetical protein
MRTASTTSWLAAMVSRPAWSDVAAYMEVA